MQGGSLSEPLEGAGADAILDRFLEWVDGLGLEPYPAQDEAFLELAADRNVILGTPTGSGKSLVAVFLHWKALCEGARSFYTAPTKALVSEKFFSLCDTFGAQSVGMLTGDASINPTAPIVCCTAEVLGSMSLRSVEAELPPYVVMDEFHYYGDRDRGVAWQLPLLTLHDTSFLLMSATLGDTSELADRIRAATGREVAQIHDQERPVPLDFVYRDTTLHETVEELLEEGLAPIYIVHFTQREAAEQAQALTSAKVSSREQRERIKREIARASFDTPYGKDLRRFLGFGIGVHHAGLLPRYRLLVEQLSQKGLLRVICGTDTLGVGVNIPIRTVLFSGLSKFDGQKVGLLEVRAFKQIAGRAGRRGFDDRGSVVCQAPVHVIENRKRQQAGKGRGKGKGGGRGGRRAPPKGPTWTKDTFQKLIHQQPEPLRSRFDVTHGMLVHLLQRGSGYRALIDLIDASHEPPHAKHRMRRSAAVLFRSLRRAGLLDIERDASGRFGVRVSDDLQEEFALDRTLDLFLVEAIGLLDPTDPDYALGVLSLIEAVQEDPRQLLYRQEARIKSDLMDQLKAERVPFDERIRLLDEVTWPKPNAEFIYGAFAGFAELHPWVREQNIRPKGIVREMFETYAGFDDYVRLYGLARSEGLLLRYLGAVYRSLVKTVPEAALDDSLEDAREYLRATIVGVDSSLVEVWESLLDGTSPAARDAAAAPAAPSGRTRLLQDERALRSRVRAELHALVRCLAARDYDAAETAVRQSQTDYWGAARFAEALAPFHARHARLLFDHAARLAEHTLLRSAGPQRFAVTQILLDPDGERDWYIEGEVELGGDVDPAGLLVRVVRIGC